MKKKTKTMCKALSVFLAFLIVVQILPLQVLAESVTDAIAHKEFIEDVLNNPTSEDNVSDAEILYEVEEKRDEHTKVYKKSDGTYTAVKTVEPLHYLKDDVWEEINNSMSLNGSLYTNLDNLFNVELPETIDSNENLTVEKDGYELSFSVDNIEESSAIVENDIVVSDTNITVADEAIAQTQSSVTYNDVAENTDLQYIVTPNSIKENIIVSNKESVKDTYTFTFETNGLNAEKLDDGSVVFKDENDEIKFRIPRPIMTDSSLAFSYDIGVTLIEDENGTVALEYSPSSEWINDSDRTYPITIDPAIMVENSDVSWVEDTWVAFDSSDSDIQNGNGYNDCLAILANRTTTDNDGNPQQFNSEIYTKFNIDVLKSLGNNIVFTEVQYLFAGASADGNALAKKISSPIDLTTVTYATKPTLDDEVIDYYTSPYSLEKDGSADFSYIHFNITKPLNEWYAGDIDNNGFAVVSGNEEYAGLFVLNGVASSSSDTTTYTTAIVMDYVDMGGYNENLNYHTQSAGRAGTGYVNDFTQQLSVIRDDVVIDEKIPLAIGMTYNSVAFEKIKSLNYNNMLAYGNNWLPNFLRAYLAYDEDKFTYYTDTGSTIDFIRSTDNLGNITFTESYSSEHGNHNYSVEYYPPSDGNDSYYTIIRPDGLVERFNNNGLLVSLSNSNATEEAILVSYDSKLRIDNMVIGSAYKAEYKYGDNNLLSKIEIKSITSPSAKPATITYRYDSSNNLIEVNSYDGELFEYSYDNNNNMTSMTYIKKYRVEYVYDTNGKIKKVTEQEYNETDYVAGNIITYDRLSSTQIKITNGNKCEIYQFSNKGSLMYKLDGAQPIHSTLSSESNLVKNGGFQNGLQEWTTTNVSQTTQSTINEETVFAVEFPGGTDAENVIYQTISIDGKKNDTIAVAGWLKGCFVNSSTNNSTLNNIIMESNDLKVLNFTNDRYAQIEVAYQYKITEDNQEKIIDERVVIPFSEHLYDWQYISDGFTLKGDCETITLFIRYSKNANKAYFSNLELIKNDGYKLKYDSNGQLSGMSLGLRDIISYTYNADGYVNSVTYTDSDNKKTVTEIEYQNNSKPTQIKENGKTKYTFSYTNGVNSSILSADNRIIRYADDFGNLSSFTNNRFYSIKNENGNPVEMFDGKEYRIGLYDVDYNIYGTSTEKSEVFVENNNAINISSTQDWYGRRSSNIISTKNDLVKVESTFGYDEENTEFDAMNQVKIYTNNIYSETRNDGFPNNKSFSYEYDEKSNIIKEYDYLSKNSMELRYSYAYDLDNRLIRYNDNVSEPNRSYSYEYDSDGNLVSKSTYTYTPLETELGEPISTEYYNAIPTSLDDAILTWNGQQLESYEITDDNNITTRLEYCYDENGLMTEKKVYVDNVLNETYYYTWAYGKLANQVYIKEGTQQAKHTIKYVYDSFNSVQGFILDHTETFLFLKNLFGDIIGLVDNAGNIVVSYEYTPWGVPTITCDNIEISSEDILKMLPLSYRGCCYDYYSGLYYVEGRYYNPKVGNFINSSGTGNSGLSEIPSNYSLFSYWENHPLWYVDSDIRETLNANSIANYLHNKQVTNNLTGYFESNNGFIFNQRADEMHQYRFGFNQVGNVGCGLVATYNALLLLENQTESHNIIPMYFHDVIRECEQIGLFAYNMGVHPFATAQFFIQKNYDVNISFSNFDGIVNDENIENIVNIMHYTHGGGTHYVAIKYENQKFKGYNAFCNKKTFDEFDSIATLKNGNNTYQGKILISISEKQ